MKFIVSLSVLLLGLTSAQADLRPEKVHPADIRKTGAYISDGMFVGGDKAINEVVVRDIRRATNKGFERIVIDLEGNHNGEPMAIAHPPYYQVAVSPDERRLVVTVFGKPQLSFDATKVLSSFKKSAVFQSASLLPKLEDDSWSFVLEMKKGKPVEVFELSDPVRLIVDVKSDR